MSISPENINNKRRGWPKGKKRKKNEDENVPKKPATGYMLFMNQRKETLLKLTPALTFSEITKIVGKEWSEMTSDEKAIFLEASEKQKETYLKEQKAYQQGVEAKKCKKNSPSTSSNSCVSNESRKAPKDFDDPIFTESFLDYNKAKESELHQLNRTNAECEQHNCILEGHIDNLKNAIIKLELETRLQTIRNKGLESKLQYFRELLCLAFANVTLPSMNNNPTMQTIDTFLLEMCNVLEQNCAEHVDFVSTVYDAMASVSFQSLDAYWEENKQELET